jgi:hypothetical protein
MTLTTMQAFDKFLATIAPTDAQRQEIASKRKKTHDYLEAAFPGSSKLALKRTVVIGSAGRGTIVRPVEDIDVMAEFRNKDRIFEQYRKDSGSFLQRISDALDAKTSIETIGARGQAVRLFYTNGAVVDIAPVFKWAGSGYALPSGDGGWITTDPEAQATWFSARQEDLGANLTRLVQLARRWNRVHSSRFHSYHLEVTVASSFGTVGGSLPSALGKLFSWAPKHIAVSDPAGHFGRLDSYLSANQLKAIKSRFKEAADRAEQALAAEAQADHAEAKRLWRIELGDEFPAT